MTADPVAILVQFKPKLGRVDDNLAAMEEEVSKAVTAGADIVVFPELALTGYFLKDLVPEVALHVDSPALGRLAALSRDIAIVAGFVEESPDFRFFNSAAYFEDGRLVHVHRKVYLPTYGLFDEQRYFARGDRFRAFDTRFGRVGMLICEDMWHLSASYILALDGATTIICPSSSPVRGVEDEVPGSAQAWQRLTAATAQFLNCRVLYCNRVGIEDGISFWGGAEAVEAGGMLAARGPLFDEASVVTTLSSSSLRRDRVTSPLLRDEDAALTLRELLRIGGWPEPPR